MQFRRFVIFSGIVAFVLAAVGTTLVVSGANADPDRKPATENKAEGGPVFKRLGF